MHLLEDLVSNFLDRHTHVCGCRLGMEDGALEVELGLDHRRIGDRGVWFLMKFKVEDGQR